MNIRLHQLPPFLCSLATAISLNSMAIPAAVAADHNDPNGINAIFSDNKPSGADLYDLFGFPSDDRSEGEKVVIALTFGAAPHTGVFDQDLMYRLHIDPDPRSDGEDVSLWGKLQAVRKKYFEQEAAEIRVTFNDKHEAKLSFFGFPEKDFSHVISTNQSVDLPTPAGHSIKAYVGGRDDAFYNDLPGFFRSINYGPQYYKIPHTAAYDMREFPIPKTLIELDKNTLFNFDPAQPQWGIHEKRPAPDGPTTWQGQQFLKDADGDYRFVYSGQDAQKGLNVNAIILEIPMSFLTKAPDKERIIRTWGESWIISAARKTDSRYNKEGGFNEDPEHYRLVDLDGVPFLDAALNEREDDRQIAYNLGLSTHYVRRFAHLGWGFGPSINALGLKSCFDSEDAEVSVYKTYNWTLPAFMRAKKCFFQRINMPDDSWNPKKMAIKPPRTFEIFIPNVASIDMDTNGTWPFGRRLEDQVATRFLSLFLDMENGCGGPCTVESLGSQALWDSAPIKPKTPPNPLANDKPFLDHFPYLAEPW